jgi:hypothetical protein
LQKIKNHKRRIRFLKKTRLRNKRKRHIAKPKRERTRPKKKRRSTLEVTM